MSTTIDTRTGEMEVLITVPYRARFINTHGDDQDGRMMSTTLDELEITVSDEVIESYAFEALADKLHHGPVDA